MGNSSSAENFCQLFERLLARESFPLEETGFSALFEVVAHNLLLHTPTRRKHWYDGVVGLTARIRKARQIVFTGEIWVAQNSDYQWKEPFEAVVTDKRCTKQGISIKITLGADHAEGDLFAAFGVDPDQPEEIPKNEFR